MVKRSSTRPTLRRSCFGVNDHAKKCYWAPWRARSSTRASRAFPRSGRFHVHIGKARNASSSSTFPLTSTKRLRSFGVLPSVQRWCVRGEVATIGSSKAPRMISVCWFRMCTRAKRGHRREVDPRHAQSCRGRTRSLPRAIHPPSSACRRTGSPAVLAEQKFVLDLNDHVVDRGEDLSADAGPNGSVARV